MIAADGRDVGFPLVTLLFTIVLMLTSALMILLVLLHKGRGGGLSDMFGGGVSSSLGGSSVAERNLDRFTVGIGVIWFACVVALGPAPGLPVSAPDAHRSKVLERMLAWLVEETRFAGAGSAPARWARPSAARPRRGRPSTYFCAHEHRSVVTFAVEAAVPESWDCPKCGLPARAWTRRTRLRRRKIEPYKTHLAYVKERRSDDEAEDILDEAVQLLRTRRKSGDIIF